jgi:hypothetical protein
MSLSCSLCKPAMPKKKSHVRVSHAEQVTLPAADLTLLLQHLRVLVGHSPHTPICCRVSTFSLWTWIL